MAGQERSSATGEDLHDKTTSATSLYGIIARDARTGVIFRRGPSRQVQLIRWDLRDDTFEHGQWLKGRVYERRCDLSPSGRLLVYFAATNRPPYGSWTAISKPPFFTALALWPKGNAWGGGGVFEGEDTLLLNHSFERDNVELADGFSLKPSIRVKPCGELSGRGEDDPINGMMRERDGWRSVEPGEWHLGGLNATTLVDFSKPQISEKPGPNGWRLQMILNAIGRQNRQWYDIDHRVVDRDGLVLVDLTECNWADWDGGDLVFARHGCLYRMSKSRTRDYCGKGEDVFQCLHDFSAARFEAVAPTRWSLKY
ncbi:hypothetical protein [Allorhizobium taibaishanense]|uniref:Uncharacterized protein n=1 Tax=Allorhizobium taibaishanense TaxID=887144 RepID=A0A7W6HS59_9HYPH|nr:hypothetical protein [Allorhizobium taibaishanense]MBB4010433.1 hypothetical protein [Allorhizobium taibaishanense]